MKKIRMGLIALVASCLCVGAASASTLRVVVVQTSDVAAYAKALQEGQALLTKKGSPAHIRAWVARYAGPEAGSVVVSVEYPDLAALAKDDALFASDAEVRAWLQSLGKIRKIVSDSIYEEAKP
jgi:hypothetical protein